MNCENNHLRNMTTLVLLTIAAFLINTGLTLGSASARDNIITIPPVVITASPPVDSAVVSPEVEAELVFTIEEVMSTSRVVETTGFRGIGDHSIGEASIIDFVLGQVKTLLVGVGAHASSALVAAAMVEGAEADQAL